MTLAEIWREEGRKEGMRETTQEVLRVFELLKQDVSIDEITEITGIDQKRIMEYKQYMRK